MASDPLLKDESGKVVWFDRKTSEQKRATSARRAARKHASRTKRALLNFLRKAGEVPTGATNRAIVRFVSGYLGKDAMGQRHREVVLLLEYCKAKGLRPPPGFDRLPPSPQTSKKRGRSAFYASPEWRRLRYRTLRDRGAKCECCNRDDLPMHVDHIKPRHRHPELELDPTNLQVLCEDCNLGKGAWDTTDWRS